MSKKYDCWGCGASGLSEDEMGVCPPDPADADRSNCYCVDCWEKELNGDDEE